MAVRDAVLIFVVMLDCGVGRAAGGGGTDVEAVADGAGIDAVASTVRELSCGC